jgi:hypothetical protein
MVLSYMKWARVTELRTSLVNGVEEPPRKFETDTIRKQ